jgi:iron(III) transport system ATP-binding protein
VASILQVDNISCRYENESAVNSATFELEKGTLACLLGPSGCGKTTVLRAIAGFQQLHTGSISLNNKCISNVEGNIPPENRNLSMVFQDHALFPHLTVEKNISAGLHGKTKDETLETVDKMLSYVRLENYRNRFPHELSGGQQQRVALARALAPRPGLLLMDEPFSNLDLELRENLGQEVRELLKEIGTTCIMVTHDQQDAFTFSDVIGVMNNGRIEQWDTPYNLYHEPITRFVANFVGDGVFIDAKITATNAVECELATLQGDLRENSKIGQSIRLLVRPDDIIHDDHSKMTARIRKKVFRGESYLYTLVLPSGNEILSLVPSHHNHAIGEDLGIKLDIDHLVYFD